MCKKMGQILEILKRKIQYNKDWNFLGADYIEGVADELKRKIQYNKDWNNVLTIVDYMVRKDLRERSSIIRIETNFSIYFWR